VLFVVGRTDGGAGAVSRSRPRPTCPRRSCSPTRARSSTALRGLPPATPSITDFGAAPAGVVARRPDADSGAGGRIRARAVETKTMPLGNRTHMTDRERALLARWIDQGALK
jgi:hypothetical protein